ncbi:MAG TPA: DUF2157 domain-containing protein [bacterium]|nr:DUF2157 domain-containing protein [bacterium]
MNEKRLMRMLSRWQEQGLLTAEQQSAIVAHERDNVAVGRGRWVLYGLLMTGGCVLGIGIISLIAANWRAIPGWIKMTTDFALLIAMGMTLIRLYDEKREMAFELVSLVFSLFCLASIGLVVQVFHLHLPIHRALLLTLALVLPVSLAARRWFMPQLWVVGLLVALTLTVIEEKTLMNGLFGLRVSYYTKLLAVPLILLALSNVTSSIEKLHRFAWAFTLWSFIAGFVMICVGDVTSSMKDIELSMTGLIPITILAMIAGGSLYLRRKLHDKVKVVTLILLAWMLALVLLYMPIRERAFSFAIRTDFLGAMFSIVAFFLLAALFVMLGKPNCFNMITIAITLRFLIVYFQVFGSLIKTGVGLIVSGLLIIGLGIVWFKIRLKLAGWMERMLA